MSAIKAIGLLLLAAHGVAQAEAIYKWTDDQGKVHYSDVVPERYRDIAKPVASGVGDPTAQERQAALARAAATAARLQASARAASSAPAAARPSDPSVPRRPAKVPNADTDCETWERLYKESLDCFGPYRTAHGATRSEGYIHCAPIDAPPSRCRPHVSE
jgi:hypothetical protein